MISDSIFLKSFSRLYCVTIMLNNTLMADERNSSWCDKHSAKIGPNKLLIYRTWYPPIFPSDPSSQPIASHKDESNFAPRPRISPANLQTARRFCGVKFSITKCLLLSRVSRQLKYSLHNFSLKVSEVSWSGI